MGDEEMGCETDILILRNRGGIRSFDGLSLSRCLNLLETGLYLDLEKSWSLFNTCSFVYEVSDPTRINSR